jgi:hypothetical protein
VVLELVLALQLVLVAELVSVWWTRAEESVRGGTYQCDAVDVREDVEVGNHAFPAAR